MVDIRTGFALGVELFLILDMALVHQTLRLHGVLFSDYFEYAVLLISVAFAAKALYKRTWAFRDSPIQNGMLIGFGGTLFLDVVLVDEILKLHAVNYPEYLNLGSGIAGLLVVLVGIFRWRHR